MSRTLMTGPRGGGRRHAAIRPTWCEIDLDAVAHNARRLADVAGAEVYAVVKADAYGHGAVAVAGGLVRARAVAGFAVSLVEEGVALREGGVTAPILVMGPALDGGHEELVARDMIPMVSDPADLEALGAVGKRRGRPVSAHIKVDTGMGRLGFLPTQLADAVAVEGIKLLAGLATHFACADTDDPNDSDSMTGVQLSAFRRVVDAVRADGGNPSVLHAANSAATLRFPASHFDWVRPGLALYGNVPEPGFRQAMRLLTQIVQLRRLPAGATVSYGALWSAPRDSQLAILPVGYADGLPRAATGRAEVLVRGQRCPVAGAICMDIAVVDVTSLGDAVRVGDEVVLLGAQGGPTITATEFAERAGLIEYEVTCGISKRVPRTYA